MIQNQSTPKPRWGLIVTGVVVLVLLVFGGLRKWEQRLAAPKPAAASAAPAEAPSSCAAGMVIVDDEGKFVPCTGPAPIEMGWEDAVRYLHKSGYPVGHASPQCSPNCKSYLGADADSLRGNKPHEELIVFTYRELGDTQPPLCISVYPEADNWRSVVSRVTGASAEKLPEPADGVAGCTRRQSGTLACRFDGRSAHGRSVPLEVGIGFVGDHQITELYFGACE